MPKVGLKTVPQSPYQHHVARWKSCERCELKDHRRQVVFVRGKLPCQVLLIGEAPGESEDVLGQPFVGPAGKLLDSILAETWKVWTPRYTLTNLVGCFPSEGKKTGDHAPPDSAIKACLPKLTELIAIARPDIVVCVGTLAAKWIMRQRIQLGLGDVKVIEIPHPAFLLRMVPIQRDQECKRCVIRIGEATNHLVPF